MSLTYEGAHRRWLTARGGRFPRLAHATWLVAPPTTCYAGAYAVRYHQTDIVTITPDNTYRLDVAAWATPTSRRRIIAYAPGIVRQRRGAWWWCRHWDDHGVPFVNGLWVDADGEVLRVPTDGRQVTAGRPSHERSPFTTVRRLDSPISSAVRVSPHEKSPWATVRVSPHELAQIRRRILTDLASSPKGGEDPCRFSLWLTTPTHVR